MTENAKENFEDNHGQNIVRIFYILQNFRFATSESKPGYK